MPGPRPREKPSGLCIFPTTDTAFGTWTPARAQKVKDRGFQQQLGSPTPFPRTELLGREAAGTREERLGTAFQLPRTPAQCVFTVRSNSVLLIEQQTHLDCAPGERGPIGSAPVSGPTGIGEQARCAEIAKEDTARSRVSSRLNSVVFRGGQPRSVPAPQPPTLPQPGHSSQAPPLSPLRAAVPRSL